VRAEAALPGNHSLVMVSGDENVVVGFVCFGVTSPHTVVVKDFCVGEEKRENDGEKVTLQQFLEFYVANNTEVLGLEGEEITVKFPSAIMVGGLYDGKVIVETKESFLYRVLNDNDNNQLIDKFVKGMAPQCRLVFVWFVGLVFVFLLVCCLLTCWILLFVLLLVCC
jgi:hypothetical protein